MEIKKFVPEEIKKLVLILSMETSETDESGYKPVGVFDGRKKKKKDTYVIWKDPKKLLSSKNQYITSLRLITISTE